MRLAAVLLQVWPTVNPLSQLLLLDEPTNSLDVAQKVALDRLLREFCQSGRSALVCAHDLNHTLQQADRVWLLQAGRLVAEGEPTRSWSRGYYPRFMTWIFICRR